jgi:hypothetical protein
LTKWKNIEFEIVFEPAFRKEWQNWFGVFFGIDTFCDHAAAQLHFTVLNSRFALDFYDSRHWNAEQGRWYHYDHASGYNEEKEEWDAYINDAKFKEPIQFEEFVIGQDGVRWFVEAKLWYSRVAEPINTPFRHYVEPENGANSLHDKIVNWRR